MREALGDAKGASPLSTGARGAPLTSGADAPALGFVSQRESVAQARARFGRGEQCSPHGPEPSTRFLKAR